MNFQAWAKARAAGLDYETHEIPKIIGHGTRSRGKGREGAEEEEGYMGNEGGIMLYYTCWRT